MFVCTHTIRRGLVAASATLVATSARACGITSSNGSATATPAARRKLRRVT